MGKRHQISRDYPVNIETLWADILDLDALAQSMEDEVTYEGMPSGPVFEGQVVMVNLKRWGWFPMGKWTMEIVRLDNDNHILESREHGGLVRCYRHRLEVIETGPNSCRYTDHLDVDAGLLTPLVFPSFRAMYEQRHEKRRARLLEKERSNS